MKYQTASALVAALLLSACTPTVTMMGRTTGDVGQGSLKGAYFGTGGPIYVVLRNERYEGTWLTVRDPGATGFSLLAAFGRNGGSEQGAVFGVRHSDSGFGTAIMHAPSGATLRCEFRYSNVTGTAIGVCQHKDGEIFDVQGKL
jgi:hypothetical protein